jgi:acylglycerol lipase
MAAAAEKGEEERRWWRGAEEMDTAVRREIAIQRLQEEAEEAGAGRSRREFAVFETARGDTLFTQSWTPAAADPPRYSHILTHAASWTFDSLL